MAIAEADATATEFEKLVRIFVDTNADTHFIVSVLRTTTVKDLRELMTMTHRHCYPDGGDVIIGKLMLPGGEHGYYIADYLRVGQVFDKWEGKVFAEVRQYNPPSADGRVIFGVLQPVLSYRSKPSPSNLQLLPLPNHVDSLPLGKEPTDTSEKREPQVSENAEQLKIPQPQRGNGLHVADASACEAVGVSLEADVLLEFQTASTQHPLPPVALPLDPAGMLGLGDTKELKKSVTTPAKKEVETKAAVSTGKPPRKKKGMKDTESGMSNRHVELGLDHSSPMAGAEESLRPETSAGSKKRGALECSERVSKFQKLIEAEVVGFPQMKDSVDCEIENKDSMNRVDNSVYKDTSSRSKKASFAKIQMDPSGELSVSPKSGAKIKKRKQKVVQKEEPAENGGGNNIAKDDLKVEDSTVEKAPMPMAKSMLNPPFEVSTSITSVSGKKRKKRRQSEADLMKSPGLEVTNSYSQAPGEECKPETKVSKLERLALKQNRSKVKQKAKEAVFVLESNASLGSGQKDEPAIIDLAACALSPQLEHIKPELRVEEEEFSIYSKRKKKKRNKSASEEDSKKIDMAATPAGSEHIVDGGELEQSIPQEFDAVAPSQTSLKAFIDLAEDKLTEKQGHSNSRQMLGTKVGRGEPSITSEDRKEKKKRGESVSKDTEGPSQSPKSAEKRNRKSEMEGFGSPVFTASFLQRKGKKSLKKLMSSDDESLQQVKNVEEPSRSTTESSRASDFKGADHEEVRSQLEAVGKNGRKQRVSLIVERAEWQVNGSDAKPETQEEFAKTCSPEVFSQDQSFQVNPTQVHKPLSGSVTEESDDDSDAKVFEGTDKVQTQETNSTHFSLKENKKLEETSDDESEDSGIPKSMESPSIAIKVPDVPILKMGSIGGSQRGKRRASGLGAEIEAKFAQFIDSQDGLDEILGISLSQRKSSVPVEHSKKNGLEGALNLETALSLAATTFGSPVDQFVSTQDSSMGNLTKVDTANVRKRNSADVAQLLEKPMAKPSTATFKVPKSVPAGRTSSAKKGGIELTGQQTKTPPALTKETLVSSTLKEPATEKNSALDKEGNSEDSLQPALKSDVPSGSVWKERSADPFLTPQREQERCLDYHSAADESKPFSERSSGKIKKKIKRKEDLQFMIVNNTDHLLEDDTGIKLLVTSEEQGSAGKVKRTSSGGGGEDTSITAIGSENLSQMLAKAKKEENIEVGVNGSVETSGLESGGKKKKKHKKKKFMAEELEGNELNILPETSMDQSERETEELYLKLEKANRDLWLHQSASSSKKEKDTHMSSEVVKVENVAQGSPEQGVEGSEDAGTKQSIADDVAQGSPEQGVEGSEDAGTKRSIADDVAQGSPEQGVEGSEDAGTKRSIADDVAQGSPEQGVEGSEDAGIKRSIADDVAQGSPEQGVEGAEDAGIKRSIADDVAQGSPEQGVEGAEDAGTKRCIADDVAQESNGGDIEQNPHLFAGTTEASDREEDVFLSQDKLVGREHEDNFAVNLPSKGDDIYDFVSGDDEPTLKDLKSAEKRSVSKAKRLDEISRRATEMVLDDEMLYVADLDPGSAKKTKKSKNPLKRTVKTRGALPSAVVAALQGVTVDSSDKDGDALGQAEDQGELPPKKAKKSSKPKSSIAKSSVAKSSIRKSSTTKSSIPTSSNTTPEGDGRVYCPVGCGRLYSKKTSAFYVHRLVCPGTPSKR